MVLEQKTKDLLVERHEKNGVLFDMLFGHPALKATLLHYLSGRAPTTSSARKRRDDETGRWLLRPPHETSRAFADGTLGKVLITR
jgi:hypothetical protein